jgi:hypothetical protein
MNLPLTDAPVTSEERIDAALEESFPASDAPWWSLGVTSVLPATPESLPTSAGGREIVRRS